MSYFKNLNEESFSAFAVCRDLFDQLNSSYFYSKLPSMLRVRWGLPGTVNNELGNFKFPIYDVNIKPVTWRPSNDCINLKRSCVKSFARRRSVISTLLHEMIHAYVYYYYDLKHSYDQGGHGYKFVKHMLRVSHESNVGISHIAHALCKVDVKNYGYWRCNCGNSFHHDGESEKRCGACQTSDYWRFDKNHKRTNANASMYSYRVYLANCEHKVHHSIACHLSDPNGEGGYDVYDEDYRSDSDGNDDDDDDG